MARPLIQNSYIKPIIILILYSSFIWLGIVQPVFSQEQETDSTRFAVIGDYGDATAPFLAEVADMVLSWNPDFIVTTGDNNYSDGEAETIDSNNGQFFHDFIFPYYGDYGEGAEENRFFPAIGNHDYTVDDTLDPHLDYFTLPGNERYYDFVREDIHFFVLNSDKREPDGNLMGSVQADWLEEALTASTSAWQIVIIHESPYSSGWHGNEPDIQWTFKEWGADAVMSGHDHHYERIILDELPYFVVGASGDDMRAVENIIPGSRIRHNTSYGAMLVTANADAIRFEYYSIRGNPLTWETFAHMEEWLELDVTTAVTEDGVYNWGIGTGSVTSVYFSSSEGDNPPQLVIDTDESSYIFTATEDTFTNPDQAERNYGDEDVLRVRYNTIVDFTTYLRFEVEGISGNIQQATLRLYPVEGDVKGGFSVFPIGDTLNNSVTIWDEDNLQANNAPPIQGVDEPIDVFTLRHDS